MTITDIRDRSSCTVDYRWMFTPDTTYNIRCVYIETEAAIMWMYCRKLK